ncbi:MAG: N-acetylmuramoyl-L-alanine amidase [Pseudomonadota bacterium]
MNGDILLEQTLASRPWDWWEVGCESMGLKTLVVVLGFLGALVPQARAEITASQAQFTEAGEATRFVLDLSGRPNYRVFVVDQPARLVVDLDDVSFDLSGEAPAAGLVADWRYGALGPSTARIVFDLAAPALISSKKLTPDREDGRARLTLDLMQVGEARFTNAARHAVAGIDAPIPSSAASAEAVVVLDPGHGGVDPGATSQSGVSEKNLVLAFAERLKERLEDVPGLAVRMTRSDDRFVSLNRRIRIARAYGADLFISIHADAAPQRFVRGATVYTLSERPSDAEAAALAARENLADSVSGAVEPEVEDDVSGILADLLRKETKTFAHAFADIVIDEMAPTVGMNSNPHRYARFRVLMAHDIPSVLLELGYLTNEADEAALTQPDWQAKAADAVAQAIAGFFDLPLEPQETAAGVVGASGRAGTAASVSQ